MQGSPTADRILRKSIRALAALLRLGLCVSLGLLLLAISIILIRGELPVPRFMLDGLRQRAEKAGYAVSWEGVHINLNGQLLVEGLNVGIGEGEANRLLSARAILVDINPLRLIAGQMLPRRFVADDLTFYCPTIVSPSGKPEILTTDLSIDLVREREHWELKTFRAQIFNLRMRADGSIPTAWITTLLENIQAQSDTNKRPFLRNYGEVTLVMLQQEAQLRNLDQPHLQLHFAPAATAETHTAYSKSTAKRKAAAATSLEVTLNLGTESYHNGELAIDSGPVFSKSIISIDDAGRVSVVAPPYASISDLKWSDKISATDMILLMPHPPAGMGDLGQILASPLDTVTLSAWGLNVYGLPLDMARLHVMTANGDDLLQGKDYIARASIANGWNHLTAFAQIDRIRKAGYIDFVSDWNPDDFDRIPRKDRPAALADGFPVIFERAPHIAGYLALGEGFQPQWASLRVSTGAARYDTLALSYAYASTLWDGRSVTVEQALAYSPEGFHAEGGYWQDLKTNQYRVRAEGTLDPSAINAVVDEEWWTQLWESFTFNPHYWPEASFAMVGTHNMGVIGKKVFVAAKMRETAYSGVAVEEASALLYMNENTVDLYNLAVRTKEGTANAHVRWLWASTPEENNIVAALATGTLPLDQIGNMIGPDTAEMLEEFKLAIPPRASLAGVISTGQATNAQSNVYLKMKLHVPSTFSYDWLMLDNIYASVYITPTIRELTNLDGIIAGGTLGGDAYLDVLEDGQLAFRAELDIKGAHLDRLDDALGFLKGSSDKPATDATGSATDPAAGTPNTAAGSDTASTQNATASANGGSASSLLDQPGLVDFNGKINGVSGVIRSMHGSGTAAIRNSDLAKINVLGVVSQLFQFLGMPVATLNFTQAQTEWELQNGIVHMPDLRIYGPTGLIDASGNIDLETMQLNYIVYLHPLGEFSVPLLSQALSLFSPLANLVQVRVSGSLSNPQFTTSLRPGNIFSGPNVVSPHDMDTPAIPLKNTGDTPKIRKLRGPASR